MTVPTLSRRILRVVLWMLLAIPVALLGAWAVVRYTNISYAMLGQWSFTGFGPIGALWVIAEKKVGKWKKEVEIARAALAEEERVRAERLLQEQANTTAVRERTQETLQTLTKQMEQVGVQVQKLVDDNTNNDGSTQRDRSDLMFADIITIRDLLASTSSIAMWWGTVDGKGNVVPTKVSDKFHRLTGMSHEQTANGGWLNFVHIKDQVRAQETIEAAYRRGRPTQIDVRIVNIVTEDEEHVRMFVTPSTNPQTRKVIGWSWECYTMNDPSEKMHRRASDPPEREAAA